MENQITHMDKHEKTIIRRTETIDEVTVIQTNAKEEDYELV